MRLHSRCVVVLMFLLMPTTALASDHVASIFGGISRLTGSTYNGGHGVVEVSFPTVTPGKLHDHVSFLVDSSVHGGTDAANNAVTKITLLVGVRVLHRPHRRLVVFAHGLGGGHRSHIGGTAQNGRAGGAGGGFDILIGAAGRTPKPGATGNPGWMFRAQSDWVKVAGKNSARVSLGFGYRYR